MNSSLWRDANIQSSSSITRPRKFEGKSDPSLQKSSILLDQSKWGPRRIHRFGNRPGVGGTQVLARNMKGSETALAGCRRAWVRNRCRPLKAAKTQIGQCGKVRKSFHDQELTLYFPSTVNSMLSGERFKCINFASLCRKLKPSMIWRIISLMSRILVEPGVSPRLGGLYFRWTGWGCTLSTLSRRRTASHLQQAVPQVREYAGAEAGRASSLPFWGDS